MTLLPMFDGGVARSTRSTGIRCGLMRIVQMSHRSHSPL